MRIWIKKKDEINKRRRVAYQRKKIAPCVQFHDTQQEATPGVLTQLDNTPTIKGELKREALISVTKISLVLLMILSRP